MIVPQQIVGGFASLALELNITARRILPELKEGLKVCRSFCLSADQHRGP
jgi:hypothetical protein